jgi:Flp pilus assembly protein TadG
VKRIVAFFTRPGKSGKRAFPSMVADTRGAIAIIAGIAMMFILMAAGAAVDGIRMFIMTTELRGLADSAAVSAGANPRNTDQATLEAVARQFIEANKRPPTVGEIGISSDYSAATHKFTLTLTSTLPTYFLRIWGITDMEALATAEILRALPGPIEIALAVDVTSSMRDPLIRTSVCPHTGRLMVTKIDVLQCGLNYLITDLANAVGAADRDKVKIGIVPFRERVHVGREYSGSSWLESTPSDWSGCVGYRAASTSPLLTNYRAVITDPTGHPYPRTPSGFPCQSFRNKIIPLAEVFSPVNKEALLATVASAEAGGFSMLPSGILWAWHLLSSEGPNPIFTQARSKTEMARVKGRKILLLFTDGNNTVGPGELVNAGYTVTSANVAEADSLQEELCANVKNDDIEIYVVSFVAASDTTDDSLLVNCSGTKANSGPGSRFDKNNIYFFKKSTPEDILDAFRIVTLSFRAVRLTK